MDTKQGVKSNHLLEARAHQLKLAMRIYHFDRQVFDLKLSA